MPVVNSHNGWDPLEEVWLGDVWPKSFYDDLEPDIRDAFHLLTDMTKEDLDNTQKFLEDWGVIVRRPFIDENRKDLYLNRQGKLFKPPISIRDTNCVIGNTLYSSSPYNYDAGCWEHVLKEYRKDPDVQFKTRPWIIGPSTTRLGRDIMFDRNMCPEYLESQWDQATKNRYLHNDWVRWKQMYPKAFEKDYRCHYTTNGGHSDGCFAPLRPGLILTTKYFKDYDLFYPGWDRISLADPTYSIVSQGKTMNQLRHMSDSDWLAFEQRALTAATGKWTLPGDVAPTFNEYVNKYCKSWVGNYLETYFEVNVLVLDPNNILCIGPHDSVFKALEGYGIKAHITPFRTRTFWDGGMHCITLDIRRRGELQDYFPERGDYGIGICKTELPDEDFQTLITEGPNSVPIRGGDFPLQSSFHKAEGLRIKPAGNR